MHTPQRYNPLLLALACALCLSAAPTPALAVSEAQFLPAHRLFMRAVQGDSAAVAPALEALVALRKTAPTDWVLLAYTGSATALQATTTWLPWQKMHYAEDGLALLDKALTGVSTSAALGPAGVPAQLEVKLVAANTFLAVPGFMNRYNKGMKLLGEVLASPQLASAPLAFRQAAHQAATQAGLKPGSQP